MRLILKDSLVVFSLVTNIMLSFGCVASVEKALNNSKNTSCQNIVNELIGNLIQLRELERTFEKGTDSFGASPSLSRLMKGYKEIQKCMSSEQKVDFFWVMLWHSDLDGEMKFYLEFVTKEVGTLFLNKSKNYRNALMHYKRSKGRLHKINLVIIDLESIHKAKSLK